MTQYTELSVNMPFNYASITTILPHHTCNEKYMQQHSGDRPNTTALWMLQYRACVGNVATVGITCLQLKRTALFLQLLSRQVD